jgi:hypothetical protein
MHLQKVINQLAYSHQISNVFDDFMQLAICCFAIQKINKINLDKCIAYIKFSYYLCNVISSEAKT